MIKRGRLAGIVQNKTIDVNMYDSLQQAIDTLKNKFCIDVTLILDQKEYVENLDFSNIFGTITLQGDKRELVGLTYLAKEKILSKKANAGEGDCSMITAGNTVIVEGSVANPDFSELEEGDQVAIADNTGVLKIYEIKTIGNNKLTFTLPPPLLDDVGCQITLLTNTRLTGEPVFSLHEGLYLTIKGITLRAKINHTILNPQASLTAYNTVSYGENECAQIIVNNAFFETKEAENSFLVDSGVSNQTGVITLRNHAKIIVKAASFFLGDSNIAVYSIIGGFADISQSRCVRGNYQLYLNHSHLTGDETVFLLSRYTSVVLSASQSVMSNSKIIGTNTGHGINVNGGQLNAYRTVVRNTRIAFSCKTGYLEAISSEAHDNLVGYYARYNALIDANACVVSGNIIDYSPASSGVPGNIEAVIIHP